MVQDELKNSLLMEMCNDALESCLKVDLLIRKYNLENEQFFIDWQDSLNEISVR